MGGHAPEAAEAPAAVTAPVGKWRDAGRGGGGLPPGDPGGPVPAAPRDTASCKTSSRDASPACPPPPASGARTERTRRWEGGRSGALTGAWPETEEDTPGSAPELWGLVASGAP